MIPRYTLPEMGAIWSEATRFRLFVEVEVAVVRARARRGLVPAADLAAIEEVTPRGSAAGARYNPEMMANVNA